MSGLASRTALCVLALGVALLGFALGAALAFGSSVPMSTVARYGLLVLALPVLLAAHALWRVKAFERELVALCTYARGVAADQASTASPSAPRFAQTTALLGALQALERAARGVAHSSAGGLPLLTRPQALRVQFIAAMGHDLRSPLNAMLGFADLVALSRPEALQAAQRGSVEIIRERARDLLTLIDAMVDWAKLGAGELTLTPTLVDVAALLHEAIEQAKQRSGARGLRVSCELQEPLGSVRADGPRLVQALLGLMDHGVRSEGAPLLTLRARLVDDATHGRQLQLELADPQLEVRAQDRTHLFEAFRPSFAPTGQRIAGLGLGTAIARALVRAQGGDVWFESRPERGLTFVLRLPVASLA